MSLQIPQRSLGKTGRSVTMFGLGGEGVLRTHEMADEAARVIESALRIGVGYFDTAPAYASSMDYLGAVIPPWRDRIFLACKTANRSRDGSLRVLEDALRRLRVDTLDLWQIHDVRSRSDIDRVFGADGAIQALTEARSQGIVKYLGITGHHDPDILLEGLMRFDFDTVLLPVSAADVHRLSFLRQVVPLAVQKGTAVIGMKAYSGGLLVRDQPSGSASTNLRYALSQPVSTVIIGCRTPQEVEMNAQIAADFEPMADSDQRKLEESYTGNEWAPYKRKDRVRPDVVLR